VDLNDIEKTKNNVVKNHGVIVQSNEVNFNFIIKKEKKTYKRANNDLRDLMESVIYAAVSP